MVVGRGERGGGERGGKEGEESGREAVGDGGYGVRGVEMVRVEEMFGGLGLGMRWGEVWGREEWEVLVMKRGWVLGSVIGGAGGVEGGGWWGG
ncbi:hypothetical protein, partial [Kocuria rhizophila]|uniref:hypothetical protein n=1 Tax=Kocuria rhizophila TaxID=72000 RepID=UPI001C92DC46